MKNWIYWIIAAIMIILAVFNFNSAQEIGEQELLQKIESSQVKQLIFVKDKATNDVIEVEVELIGDNRKPPHYINKPVNSERLLTIIDEIRNDSLSDNSIALIIKPKYRSDWLRGILSWIVPFLFIFLIFWLILKIKWKPKWISLLPLFIISFGCFTSSSIFHYNKYRTIESNIFNEYSKQSDIYNENNVAIFNEIEAARKNIVYNLDYTTEQLEELITREIDDIKHVFRVDWGWKKNSLKSFNTYELKRLQQEKKKNDIIFFISTLLAVSSLICIIIHFYFTKLNSEIEKLTKKNNRLTKN